ncbi:MAG: hypothetical protein LC725_08470 [Lentisphaerae bacterium]|nr:hypothetical protein [Lentisphaerota bacterium]
MSAQQKELWVTVDYFDDVLRAGRLYSREDLDAMMAYVASLGASRLQWIVDTAWTLYHADSPQGFDLLNVASEAAHRHGLRFDAIFKPFEGALSFPIRISRTGSSRSADCASRMTRALCKSGVNKTARHSSTPSNRSLKWSIRTALPSPVRRPCGR